MPPIAAVLLALALGQAGSYPWTHVRTLAPNARALVIDAAARAPLVRALADELETTDVIVYVVILVERTDLSDRGGSLVLLGSSGQARFLEIRISAWDSFPDARIAMLGHELRHALEVAAAPEVRDAPGMEVLFQRIGYEAGDDHFETDAAREAEAQVREELLESERGASE